MLTGLEKLNLLPSPIEPIHLKDQIARLFSSSISLKASIAFWTLSFEDLNDLTGFMAERVLCNSESFLCADIQRPTNIDHLAAMVRRGVKIYLNIRKLPKHIDPHRISSSPGLLHTKILLADKPNERSEFWVGSHNWTIPALIGPNTELSLSIELVNRAPLYLAARQVLEDIRDNLCRAFDLEMVDYYKRLQQEIERSTPTNNVIELEGESVDRLGGEVICIFGTENDDFDAVSTVRKKVFLSVYDSTTREKYLYSAKIVQTGLLRSASPNAGGLSMSERRYAFTKKREFPYLHQPTIPGEEILNTAYFFSNIEIIGFKSNSYRLYDPSEIKKKEPAWTDTEWDPTMERIDSQLVSRFYKGQFDLQSLISVPFDDERAAKGGAEKSLSKELLEYSGIPLEAKRSARDYRLISKRVIEL